MSQPPLIVRADTYRHVGTVYEFLLNDAIVFRQDESDLEKLMEISDGNVIPRVVRKPDATPPKA